MPPSNKRVPAIRFSGFVEEWKENKVADLAERFYGGGTPSTIASEYWGGETAWIQSSDLGEGELFNVVPKRKVTLKALKETNIQLIPSNSIAVVTRVGVGKLALMEYSYTTSQDFCSLANLRANPAMLSYLLYLELNYKGVSVQGTAIKGITKNDLDSINLFIPDGRSEQSRIGQFFRTLDKLIKLRKKKLDKLIALKKELLNKLFPQQGQKIPAIRFSGFVEEWKENKFADTVMIERGGSPRPIEAYVTHDTNGLNWVKIGDAPEFGNYITQTAEKIRPEGLKKTREVHPNDLILSNSMSFGRPYIMKITGCIHDGWLLIRNNRKIFDLHYLCYMLSTNIMLCQYEAMAAGSTVHNLNKELVGNTFINYPEINEQSRIGQFFRTLDKLIELRKKEVDKMIALKKELLNKLFVG